MSDKIVSYAEWLKLGCPSDEPFYVCKFLSIALEVEADNRNHIQHEIAKTIKAISKKLVLYEKTLLEKHKVKRIAINKTVDDCDKKVFSKVVCRIVGTELFMELYWFYKMIE